MSTKEIVKLYDCPAISDLLRMIRDHIAASHHLERDDLELAPFDANGGLGQTWQLFGEDMDRIIDEMNEVLAV